MELFLRFFRSSEHPGLPGGDDPLEAHWLDLFACAPLLVDKCAEGKVILGLYNGTARCGEATISYTSPSEMHDRFAGRFLWSNAKLSSLSIGTMYRESSPMEYRRWILDTMYDCGWQWQEHEGHSEYIVPFVRWYNDRNSRERGQESQPET